MRASAHTRSARRHSAQNPGLTRYTLSANLAKAPPRPPWARRTSAVHEVVAEKALLVPFGVAGMVFLDLVTGLALAILYPVCSAETELLHKRARTNAPNIPAQIVSVDDIDSDGAEQC